MARAQNGPSRLSEVISARLEETDMSIKDLSDAIDIVYEHTRRIVRGEAVPSKQTLKVICTALKLNYTELLETLNEAKVREKYGDLPLMMAGRKPSLEPLERVWDMLAPEQQQDIISMAKAWTQRSRAIG